MTGEKKRSADASSSTMGVPLFYSWLRRRYSSAVEKLPEDPSPSPTDAPPPSLCDRLYLDMNGVIHPCVHGANKPAPGSEEKMFEEVCIEVDRLVSASRPSELVFLAIDGVAPRAKMNQQRSRRFRAAQDAGATAADEEAAILAQRKDVLLRTKWERAGLEPGPAPSERFDYNVITPGTEFLADCAAYLRRHVERRLASSEPAAAAWQGLRVVLSDSSVPGEGEHKIMDFIRIERQREGYDAATRHAIVGLDADLMLLALAAHEPHFIIVREIVLSNAQQKRADAELLSDGADDVGGQLSNARELEHDALITDDIDARAVKADMAASDADVAFYLRHRPLELVRIGRLRQLLVRDLRGGQLSGEDGGDAFDIEVDREQAIDDFVLMVTMVGNDFLPHLPSLHIHEGSLDELLRMYVELLPALADAGRRLTSRGEMNAEAVEMFLAEISMDEEPIIEKRMRKHSRKREFESRLKTHKRSLHSGESVLQLTGRGIQTTTPAAGGRIDWRQKYYASKLEFDPHQPAGMTGLASLCSDYIAGLEFIMLYYYQGCPSWNWYFPHHYAPLASDLVDAPSERPPFERGVPWSALRQLMATMPVASNSCLPLPCRRLMSDPASPLAEYYPIEFEVDINGKLHDWEAVVRLPFIDADVLSAQVTGVTDELTAEEQQRDVAGDAVLLTDGEAAAFTVERLLPAPNNPVLLAGASREETLDGMSKCEFGDGSVLSHPLLRANQGGSSGAKRVRTY